MLEGHRYQVRPLVHRQVGRQEARAPQRHRASAEADSVQEGRDARRSSCQAGRRSTPTTTRRRWPIASSYPRSIEPDGPRERRCVSPPPDVSGRIAGIGSCCLCARCGRSPRRQAPPRQTPPSIAVAVLGAERSGEPFTLDLLQSADCRPPGECARSASGRAGRHCRSSARRSRCSESRPTRSNRVRSKAAAR